jgi:YggT family protein
VLTWAIVGTLLVVIKIYYYAILGSIIMSFVMMFSGSMNPHPMLLLIWQLTEPIMAPVRQIIPPLGGLDLSPILIFLIIRLLQDFFIGAFDLGRYSAVILGL